MRIIGIGDLVVDYYYKDGKFIGLNGGKSVFNLIFHLAKNKFNTYIYGVCGEDFEGDIAIKSLKDVGVNTDFIIRKKIDTRCMHVSINLKEKNTIMKQNCPLCGRKKWYENTLISSDLPKKLMNNVDTIIAFDIINKETLKIIDLAKKKNYKTIIDIGHIGSFRYLNFNKIIERLQNKFNVVQINDSVANFLIDKLNLKKLLDLIPIFNSDLVVITHGKNGTTFLYNDKEVYKKLLNPQDEIDSTGAGDAFFSVVIKYYINYKYVITEDLINKIFDEAVKLTSKVVNVIGARTIYQPLSKKKKDGRCICESYKEKK